VIGRDPWLSTTDSFVAPRAGWTVQASWAGDAAHTGAVSNSCEFAIPIG
jgi:hypothetical protein